MFEESRWRGCITLVKPVSQDPCSYSTPKCSEGDTRNNMRDKDGITVKMPSSINMCQIQLWEIFIVVSILMLQPPSTMLTAHIKALLHHKDSKYYCESVLKEHINIS